MGDCIGKASDQVGDFCLGSSINFDALQVGVNPIPFKFATPKDAQLAMGIGGTISVNVFSPGKTAFGGFAGPTFEYDYISSGSAAPFLMGGALGVRVWTNALPLADVYGAIKGAVGYDVMGGVHTKDKFEGGVRIYLREPGIPGVISLYGAVEAGVAVWSKLGESETSLANYMYAKVGVLVF